MKNIITILCMFIMTISVFAVDVDKYGNIQDIEIKEYNIITEKDDIIVTQLKHEAQIKALLEFLDIGGVNNG